MCTHVALSGDVTRVDVNLRDTTRCDAMGRDAQRCVAKLCSACVLWQLCLMYLEIAMRDYMAILRDVTRCYAISCAVTRCVPPKGLYSLCLRTPCGVRLPSRVCARRAVARAVR